MIKLFRNIRKNLLNEGKTTKYFKYAIGEIILVVIGILIALQLNSWKETNAERNLEKQYITSLIEDIKKDTDNFNAAITLNEELIRVLDSFASMCFNYEKEQDSKFCVLHMNTLRHPNFVNQTDRTLTQLRNAGGMRLISQRTTADSIIQYEDYFKKLGNQQVFYESMLKDLANAGIPVFNFKYYPKLNQKLTQELFDAFNTGKKLESPDEKLIIQLGNTTSMYRNVTNYYLSLLGEGKQKSLDLINILQTDYKIN